MTRWSISVAAYSSLLWIASCHSSPTPVREDVSVRIEIEDQHPFLTDHGKRLVVSRGKKPIASVALYPDAGDYSSIATLFREGQDLVLIDADGIWYVISESGQINCPDWSWRKPLPKEYVGTFETQKRRSGYQLIRHPEVTLDSVYRFKDPPDSKGCRSDIEHLQ